MFGQRLVHLDLKGAPPKIDYLIKLLPILKKLGCTGLLIEYEDTFPYTGSLAILKNKNHYKEEELRKLFEACIVHKLTVVPLIQCLGHAEFILKHYRFSHLREHPHYPNVLCASSEKTIQLICNMIEQIVSVHTKYIDLNHIHLGCDEVYLLGNCQACLNQLNEHPQWTKECIFLNHVSKLAKIVKSDYSLKPIIWEDMIRSPTVTANMIEQFELNRNSLNLMVWHYCDLNNFQLTDEQLWSSQLFCLTLKLIECFNDYKILKEHPSLKGAFTDYAVKQSRVNPLHIQAFLGTAKLLQSKFEFLATSFEIELKQIFNDDTVQEWLESSRVRPYLNKLNKLVTNCNQQLSLNGFCPNDSTIDK